MKKILIMASQRNGNKDKFITYLQDYFKDKDIEIYLEVFSSVSIILNQDKIEMYVAGRNVRDFNLVYFRGTKGYMALTKTMATVLEYMSIPYIDGVWGKAAAVGDKLTSFARLTTHQLPVIPTLYCDVEDTPRLHDFIKEVDYPIIAKDLTSQRLEGVYVIHNFEDIDKLPKEKKSGLTTSYLFQKFIDIKSEYRLVVLGNNVKITHTKVARNYEGQKVTNLDEMSNVEFLDSSIMEEANDIAIKGARALDLDVAGVDICIENGTNKPWIIEVNRGPGIDYDTAFSPEMSEFARYLEKSV